MKLQKPGMFPLCFAPVRFGMFLASLWHVPALLRSGLVWHVPASLWHVLASLRRMFLLRFSLVCPTPLVPTFSLYPSIYCVENTKLVNLKQSVCLARKKIFCGQFQFHVVSCNAALSVGQHKSTNSYPVLILHFLLPKAI